MPIKWAEPRSIRAVNHNVQCFQTRVTCNWGVLIGVMLNWLIVLTCGLIAMGVINGYCMGGVSVKIHH